MIAVHITLHEMNWMHAIQLVQSERVLLIVADPCQLQALKEL